MQFVGGNKGRIGEENSLECNRWLITIEEKEESKGLSRENIQPLYRSDSLGQPNWVPQSEDYKVRLLLNSNEQALVSAPRPVIDLAPEVRQVLKGRHIESFNLQHFLQLNGRSSLEGRLHWYTFMAPMVHAVCHLNPLYTYLTCSFPMVKVSFPPRIISPYSILCFHPHDQTHSKSSPTCITSSC